MINRREKGDGPPGRGTYSFFLACNAHYSAFFSQISFKYLCIWLRIKCPHFNCVVYLHIPYAVENSSQNTLSSSLADTKNWESWRNAMSPKFVKKGRGFDSPPVPPTFAFIFHSCFLAFCRSLVLKSTQKLFSSCIVFPTFSCPSSNIIIDTLIFLGIILTRQHNYGTLETPVALSCNPFSRFLI